MRADNAAWFEAHLSTLQRQAALWEQQKRPDGLLLHGEALAEAERWAEAHEAELEPHEQDFLATCRKARRQSRRIRMWAAIAVAVAVVAIIAAVFGVTGQQRASKAEATAVANANLAATREAEAVVEKKRADEKAIEADEQRKIAVEKQNEALKQKQEADDQRKIAESETQRADREKLEAQGQALKARSGDLAARALTELIVKPDASGALAILLAREAVLTTWRQERNYATDVALLALNQAVQNNTLWERNLQRGRHHGEVRSAFFSADGKRIVTAGSDGTVRVWLTFRWLRGTDVDWRFSCHQFRSLQSGR